MGTNALFFFFLILCASGALLSLFLPDRKNPLALAGVASLASLVILLPSGEILLSGRPFQAELWTLPFLGKLVLSMDRLSAFFVFLTGLVFLPVSIYSAGYLQRYAGRYHLKTFSAFYHLLLGSTVLVLVSGDILSFLLSWEAMSILCYLLGNFEH